jgi:type II secretory pathway component PulK
VLIVTLWVLVILAIVALTFAETMSVEARAASNDLERTRALYAAKAGVQRAILAIRADTSGYAADSSSWAALNSDDDQFPFQDERYDVTVTDECGKLDLNTGAEQQLGKLPEMTAEMIDALLDWIDADDNPRANGAENDYYSRLSPPRAGANRPFLTLDELLLVKGVTKEAYYGADQGQALSLNAPPPVLQPGQPTPLRDLLTINSGDNDLDAQGQARLNINDTDEETLAQGTQGILTEADIKAIMDARDKAGSFRSIGDLLTVAGLSRDKMQSLADLITTQTHSAGQTTGQPRTPGGPTPPGSDLPGPGDTNPTSAESPRQGPEPEPPAPPEPQPPAPTGPSAPAGGASAGDAKTYRPGIVNINTAPADVLGTLDGMTQQAVEAIINYRATAPFVTRGDLLKLTEVTDGLFAQIAERVTVRSSALRITSVGSVDDGRIRVQLTAVVDLKGTQPTIVSLTEG